MKSNGSFLGQSLGAVSSPFGLRGQGFISVPYPALVWWVKNRYIPPYSEVPDVPIEDVEPVANIPAFGMVGLRRHGW